ncbi:PPPDE putative peptidase domain-containing protein [Parasitella parasitica]|nr:PPPDE putative peptidase domain-containing protein [Parasitella parasitica]
MLEYLSSFFNGNTDFNDSTKQHGVFHSGVEVGGKEYCFGGHEIPNVTGVFVIQPRTGIPELSLKQTFDIGATDLSVKEIEDLLLQLSDEFTGPSYNLLTRNCNHFTEELVMKLTQKTIPAWINRAAKLGNMFPCVVPWEWIQPPEFSEEAEEEVLENDQSEEVEDYDDADEENIHSRRSSTISLLSSRRTSHEGRNSSQERLIIGGHGGVIYHPPITKFQGVIYGLEDPSSPASSSA